MPKLTASQAAILEALRGGAFIQWRGIGHSGKDVLHIPSPGGVADFETRTVPSAAMGALVRSGLIKRVGSPFSRDARWIAA